MLKKILFFIVFTLLCIFSVNSAEVKINTNIYSESTIFDYYINFDENESYKSFSFEKPRDAKLIYALESGSNIGYSQSGDYFIFKPEDVNGKNFLIRFVSVSKSEQILNEHLFSVYTNFNFPVDNLTFTISLKEDLGEFSEIVPRNYEITKSGNVVWKVSDVTTDTFFLIKFTDTPTTKNSFYSIIEKYWHIGLLLLVLFIFIGTAIVFKKRGYIEKINVEKLKINPFKKKEKQVKQEIVDEEKFEELTSKYLTDNEKEVVEVVKNNQGISQYDILNHLPTITKSNLSKIISKLHARKILSRIKVGKINKIYLGDKIEKGKIEENTSDE